MKQQLQALGAGIVFFAIGAVFLLLVRGVPYIFDFVSLLDGDIFAYATMAIVSLTVLIGFQQAMYWLVIRRLEVDRG
jgi:hypothetical protein